MEQINFTGNERQLKLLLKAIRENDIPSWNNFVKTGGKYFVANLTGIDLSYMDLKEINLKGANLKGANLEGCNLTRANLDRTKLMNANLNNTNLSKAVITNSFLKEATMQNSNAAGANFKNSDLEMVNLDGAILEDATIINTSFKNASLFKTNLKGVKKSKAARIIAKPKKRELTSEDVKKLSPWKLAKQEETMRRVSRIQNEKAKRQRELDDNIRAMEKLNRNIFTNGTEAENTEIQ